MRIWRRWRKNGSKLGVVTAAAIVNRTHPGECEHIQSCGHKHMNTRAHRKNTNGTSVLAGWLPWKPQRLRLTVSVTFPNRQLKIHARFTLASCAEVRKEPDSLFHSLQNNFYHFSHELPSTTLRLPLGETDIWAAVPVFKRFDSPPQPFHSTLGCTSYKHFGFLMRLVARTSSYHPAKMQNVYVQCASHIMALITVPDSYQEPWFNYKSFS